MRNPSNYGFSLKGKRGFLRKAVFDVLSMLNFNLMPTLLHFASQNRPKIHENVDPKRLPIMHQFSLRFWDPKTSLLGPNLDPSWPSVSHQDGPRGFPDLPQEASQTKPKSCGLRKTAKLLFVLARWRGRSFAARWITISIYVYIYIYMCVYRCIKIYV